MFVMTGLSPLLLLCWPVGLLARWPGLRAGAAEHQLAAVRYNSLKTAAKAEGELKAQLDDVDKAIADARRTGNIGEVRRQIREGPRAAGQASVDAAARLPQFAGAAQRAHGGRFVAAVCAAPRADLSACDRADAGADHEGVDSQARAAGAAGRGRQRRPPPSRELGHIRRHQPRSARIAVRDGARSCAAVEDGAMVIEAEVFDGATSLGASDPGRVHQQGTRCKAEGARNGRRDDDGRGARRRAVSRRLHQERQSRPHRAAGSSTSRPRSAKAEAILAGGEGRQGSVQGQDRRLRAPLPARRAPNEIMPYRVYVPKGYAPSKATPLRDCAARPGRQRGFVLRFLLAAAAAAGGEARLPDGGAARLPP